MELIELQRLKITWRAESVSHSGFARNMCSGTLQSELYASKQRQIMAEVLAMQMTVVHIWKPPMLRMLSLHEPFSKPNALQAEM